MATGPVDQPQQYRRHPAGAGHLTGALQSYRASLDIRQLLAAQDPYNAVWERVLFISKDYIGGIQQAKGDLTGALQSHRASLDIRQRLAAQDPNNAGWQRDLSISHNNIGGIKRAQGNLTGALQSLSRQPSSTSANAWRRRTRTMPSGQRDLLDQPSTISAASSGCRATLTGAAVLSRQPRHQPTPGGAGPGQRRAAARPHRIPLTGCCDFARSDASLPSARPGDCSRPSCLWQAATYGPSDDRNSGAAPESAWP